MLGEWGGTLKCVKTNTNSIKNYKDYKSILMEDTIFAIKHNEYNICFWRTYERNLGSFHQTENLWRRMVALQDNIVGRKTKLMTLLRTAHRA